MKFKKIVLMSVFVVMGMRVVGYQGDDGDQPVTSLTPEELAANQARDEAFFLQNNKNRVLTKAENLGDNRNAKGAYSMLTPIQKLAAKLIIGEYGGFIILVYKDMEKKIGQLRSKYLFGNEKEALAAANELEARFYLLELVKNDEARKAFKSSINIMVKGDVVQNDTTITMLQSLKRMPSLSPIDLILLEDKQKGVQEFNDSVEAQGKIEKYASIASKGPSRKSFIEFLKKIVSPFFRNKVPKLGAVNGATDTSELTEKEKADLVKEEEAVSREVISELRKMGVSWDKIEIQFPKNNESAKVFLTVLHDMKKAEEIVAPNKENKATSNQETTGTGESDDAGDLEKANQAVTDQPAKKPIIEKAPAPVVFTGKFSEENPPTVFKDFGKDGGGIVFNENPHQTVEDLVKYMAEEMRENFSQIEVHKAALFVREKMEYAEEGIVLKLWLSQAIAKVKGEKAAADKIAATKAEAAAKEIADQQAEKAAEKRLADAKAKRAAAEKAAKEAKAKEAEGRGAGSGDHAVK